MFNLKREGMAEKELKSIIIIKKDREKKKEKKWKRKVGESRSWRKTEQPNTLYYTRGKRLTQDNNPMVRGNTCFNFFQTCFNANFTITVC